MSLILKIVLPILVLFSLYAPAYSQGGNAASVQVLAPIQSSGGQGVWEQLQPRSSPVPVSSNVDPRQLCEEAKTLRGWPKCRGYYHENNYTLLWVNQPPIADHGVLVEILSNGSDTVACWNAGFDLDEFSPCVQLAPVADPKTSRQ